MKEGQKKLLENKEKTSAKGNWGGVKNTREIKNRIYSKKSKRESG